MKKDTVGIECKSCAKLWKIEIEISNNKVESFATVCECGEIIVGNRRNDINGIDGDLLIKNRYLTNGAFFIFSTNIDDIKGLPILNLE